jgi:hypothetical protein
MLSPAVSTTCAWCMSRSSIEAAVVCSGEEPAPGVKGPVAGDAEGPSFVGGGDEPEQELGAGEVEGCEAELVDDQFVRPAAPFPPALPPWTPCALGEDPGPRTQAGNAGAAFESEARVGALSPRPGPPSATPSQ